MPFRKKPAEAHWMVARRIKDLVDAGDSDPNAAAKVCAQLQGEGEYLTRDDVTRIGEVLDQIIVKPATEGYWDNMIAGNCAPILGPLQNAEKPQAWLSKYWFIPAGVIGLIILRKGR